MAWCTCSCMFLQSFSGLTFYYKWLNICYRSFFNHSISILLQLYTFLLYANENLVGLVLNVTCGLISCSLLCNVFGQFGILDLIWVLFITLLFGWDYRQLFQSWKFLTARFFVSCQHQIIVHLLPFFKNILMKYSLSNTCPHKLSFSAQNRFMISVPWRNEMLVWFLVQAKDD